MAFPKINTAGTGTLLKDITAAGVLVTRLSSMENEVSR